MSKKHKAAKAAARAAAPAPKPSMKISDAALSRSRHKPTPVTLARGVSNPFVPASPPPGVVPAGTPGLAFDDNSMIVAAGAWAGGFYNYAFNEGLTFLGYAYLSELAQRAEYRMIVDTIATEMTRKWIEFETGSDEEDKTDKIKAIESELDRLKVRDAFTRIAAQDGYFGRAHLYIDTGDTDNPNELITPLGDGRDATSKAKVRKGGIKGVRTVEAVWTYPTGYNSSDPLKDNWYRPDVWFVMGKQIHASRLLCFIGREVPDLLKPAYSFGGLAMTQIAKPYVDNWLQTRQSVSDIISAFTTFVLSTNLGETLQVGGEQLFKRVDLFNQTRDNRGTMVIDKDSEAFQNVAAPLSGLDQLQAQSQEHMASPEGLPLVKLFGTTPAGLNATAEPELRAFYDKIGSRQESFYRPNLTKVIDFVQLSLFGEVDQAITFKFVPLWALTEKEEAELRKMDADTDQVLIDTGVIAPEEARTRVANDPGTPYHGLDPNDAPDLLEEEQEGGIEPVGGRPDPDAEKTAE